MYFLVALYKSEAALAREKSLLDANDARREQTNRHQQRQIVDISFPPAHIVSLSLSATLGFHPFFPSRRVENISINEQREKEADVEQNQSSISPYPVTLACLSLVLFAFRFYRSPVSFFPFASSFASVWRVAQTRLIIEHNIKSWSACVCVLLRVVRVQREKGEKDGQER